MNESKIRPLHDRVLIRRRKADDRTPGGIYIPDTAKDKALEGEVLAVGPGRWNHAGTERIPMSVKPGDVVLFGKHVQGIATGSVARSDQLSPELVILHEEDVMGVVS